MVAVRVKGQLDNTLVFCLRTGKVRQHGCFVFSTGKHVGEKCSDPSDCGDNMTCSNTENGTTCQCVQDYVPADDWSCGESRICFIV